MFKIFLLTIFITIVYSLDSRFKGCYKTRHSTQSYNVRQLVNPSIAQCIQECYTNYYRYSIFRDRDYCICDNYLGEEVNNSMLCDDFCPGCDLKSLNLTDVYLTGNLVPGPPENVKIKNITDRGLHISWESPKSFTQIQSYLIKAVINHTYATYIPRNLEWSYGNDTFRTQLILLPATKYNITICAVSPYGLGASYSQIVETQIGEPENLPEKPKIIKKYKDKIEIKIFETLNSNGPISSYLVVVINRDSQALFQEESLKSYNEARNEGINYYIAADLKPKDINRNFIVGDGHYYNGYYNAPLMSDVSYDIRVGIISRLNGVIKRAFSIENHEEEQEEKVLQVGDSPAVVIGLSIGIGLLSFMFIAGIIGFIILKSRVSNRRHILSENQELTLQGPMIEVENNGYIPEEEHFSKANHYKNLKQKVRSIPYNQLKIEPNNSLGIGKFGRVNSGSIYENDTLVPVTVYSIYDKKLSSEDKKSMLCDLDVLIRSGKHENVLALIGTCETSQMVLVMLEYVSMNLKDLLLGSRDSLPGRFSNMSESQALDIATNIARGMAHLESNRIVHKQLCARNIMISNGFIPKISGYGLAQFYTHNNVYDYTRWTALEVFKGQNYVSKSDVWSFACLLWEICVLGGTPYGNSSNNEIPDKIIKGLRLPQMEYISDELYQIMLDCWQIDLDERPNFNALVESLKNISENTLIPCLSFNLFPNFQYEQFYPDMEMAVRSVL